MPSFFSALLQHDITRQIRRLFSETIREWGEDNGSAVAAALAYYSIFSLSPLLIVIALVLGLLIGANAAEDRVLNPIESTLGSDSISTLETTMEQTEDINTTTSISSIAIWLAVVVWGVTGIFTQIQRALNIIWEVRVVPGRATRILIKNRLLALLTILSAGLFIVTLTVVNSALAASSHAFWVRPLQLLITLTMMTFVFGAIYKILPDVFIHWKDVLVGSAFTSVLFLFGQFAVSLYLSTSDVGSVYGAAGSLTVILVWIYYSAQIFLFGAEFTEVWARQHGAIIVPDEDAEWVNPEKAAKEQDAARKFRQTLEMPPAEG